MLDGRELVALNAWAGNMAAGDRGVCHEMTWEKEWVDALLAIHQVTGVSRFNVLLGRGGRTLTDSQTERFRSFAEALWNRCNGMALVEPLSGMGDYPVRSIADAGGVGAERISGRSSF